MKEHFPYLLWAYNIIWILIAGYLGVIFARQRTIRRQIEELKSRLDRSEQRPD
jgi:CcmD family protein